jgi:hypothetical protein
MEIFVVLRCSSGPVMTRLALLSGLSTGERLRYTLSLVNQCAEFMRSGSAAPWQTFLMKVMAIAKTGKVLLDDFQLKDRWSRKVA